MKRIILVTLFLGFFGFSSAFAEFPQDAIDNLPYQIPFELNNVTYTNITLYKFSWGTPPIIHIIYCSDGKTVRAEFNQWGSLNLTPYGDSGQCIQYQIQGENYSNIYGPYYWTISNDNPASTSVALSTLILSTTDILASATRDYGGAFGFNQVTTGDLLVVASSFGGTSKQLNITRSPQLGGGVIVTPPLEFPIFYCGLNGKEECDLEVNQNGQVTLEARPNSGYAFSHWVINNQTMGDTDGEIDVWMNEDKDVVAVYYLDMKLPLAGGKNWLLSVEAGGQRQCNLGVDSYHTDTGYYALDFTDNTLEDGHLEGTDVPIRAALGGFVDFAGGDPNDNGYGYNVVINHGNGYKTRYAHLKNEPTVSGTVTQGQLIGIMGNTGNSTGIHLHFQVYHDDDSSLNNEGIGFVRLENSTLGSYQVGCNEFYLSTNN